MKVKMLKTVNGSENGYTVSAYQAGETYEMSERLASHFVGASFAVLADVAQVKMELDAPENKALDAANYENKSAKKKGK